MVGAPSEAAGSSIVATEVEPVIDRILPLEKIADAFALMKRGGHFGKIVIEL